MNVMLILALGSWMIFLWKLPDFRKPLLPMIKQTFPLNKKNGGWVKVALMEETKALP